MSDEVTEFRIEVPERELRDLRERLKRTRWAEPETVALCAWMIENFWAWTDCDGHLENVLTRDELLDNLMLYWLPATGASSARLYWESIGWCAEL